MTAFEIIDTPNVVEQGWQCPVCKAVMSPKEKVCINCRGIVLLSGSNFPETSQYVDVNEFHKSTSQIQQTKGETK